MSELQESAGGLLQSVIYDAETMKLQVLDQLKLPSTSEYMDVTNMQETHHVIRNMHIRGAPLIAIVAILGFVVDLQTDISKNEIKQILNRNQPNAKPALLSYLFGKLDYLGTSRPTAVNLFNAISEIKEILQKTEYTATDLVPKIVEYGNFMLQRDLQDNRNIGKFGAQTILETTQPQTTAEEKEKVTVLTICNTGSLATAGYGTALGVVRALHEQRKLDTIVSLETRPYNQGSRLTCYELLQDKLPNATLICDSMAAYYMAQAQKKEKARMAVVVGADRIASNGDTANKIGTYHLAVAAKAHGVPFFVAAPFTTIDLQLQHGDEIPIEERPANELIETSRAPDNMPVWNPSFDVTPAKYISGIVTEKGVIRPDANGHMNVKSFVAKHTSSDAEGVTNGRQTSSLPVPPDYTEQTVQTLSHYLAKNVPKAMEVLGASSAEDLECVEMGDGNLNLVFIVSNRQRTTEQKKVIVKQALPYVRCVGESWPLTLERSYFEYTALEAEKAACPEFVPDLYHFSRSDALIVMEYLAPPNIILRKGLIQGIQYPTMAADIGTFCAKTLFLTSGFAMGATELREKVEFWSQNKDMCELTEKVIFTEPYIVADNNRWTSPQLDDDKKAIETDVALKQAANEWKQKFVTQTQALIHADLHTGSVMCSPSDHQTFVIDPEFAFYGPAAFDTGAFVANLFLAYVSQEGHRPGDDYGEWILEQIEVFWKTFTEQFLVLWNDPTKHTGFVYGRDVLNEDLAGCQEAFMQTILADTLGFAGMKMLRRIVGIAHVEDLDSIQDADVRAICERRGLAIAKNFIKTANSFGSMEDATALARKTPN